MSIAVSVFKSRMAKVSEELESTQGEICIKKTGKDLETFRGLRTNA
ncbi:MAG: hypothetical protein V3T67_02350 [Nitrosopumilaceae archaeon]|jgi:hypothetical protein